MSGVALRAHLTERPAPGHLAVLRSAAGPRVGLTFGEEPASGGFATLVDGVPSREHLEASPGLTTLIIPWAGLPARTRDLVRSIRPDLGVHNLHHNAGPTAELAIALYLAAAKGIVPRDADLRRGDWSNRERMDLALGVAGKSALVWGAGAIGQRVATTCRALGLEVTLVGRTARRGVRGGEELEDLLPRADVFFVCVPLTPETTGRIGAAQIARLPGQAILVNVGRGRIVEEAALYGALASRRLFAAGLDVWWHYPEGEATEAHPSGHPFQDLDNVVMSPHRAGHVQETEELRMRALGESLRAQAEGRPAPWPVDLERGY